MNLLEEIQYYWNHRYTGYSKVNQKELEGIQRERWKKQFKRLLPENQNLKVLDIGTGPGFFTIILEELGYSNITGVDYTSIWQGKFEYSTHANGCSKFRVSARKF